MEFHHGRRPWTSSSIIIATGFLALVFNGNLISVICNDASFLPQSHLVKQYTDSACWGHEANCPYNTTHVDCSVAYKTKLQHNVGDKSASDVFFSQADFGYLKEFISSLRTFCRPETQFDSSLTCSAYLQFCTGLKLIKNYHLCRRYSLQYFARASGMFRKWKWLQSEKALNGKRSNEKHSHKNRCFVGENDRMNKGVCTGKMWA